MSKFSVSCSHRDPRWRLKNAPFRENCETDYRIHQDRGDGSWSASAPNFGCGKSYPTPERAIHALLFENGASFIIITPEG
ncbi:hypothetical protein SAMN06265338_12619 [Rhodoblastus acidophilus]|uniref:Uncharacterized protein n=1 Tax=Rhodoblastus acidophilus TaxID=1074 RepID=A0A212SCU5_RHOAC|nr:hypothetical protein [Rhodoblastus acidophilus]PPQ35578.1 hypothetical protein CKO16_20255 [Rhodoblastus acidophilus]RAI16997.1 hypothetical protein CH337_18475 [Rhodoblastus acidophilus]SNB83385.1 hypothetical protein SAMN06265338_12619 [Rhodoblastus acidophilus]